MNRYLLKFEKTGQLRYTSHLDIMRLFTRNFKRAGIDLVYSKGFNPHPKISFAQALSLGHESRGEYVEIETQRAFSPDMIMGLVNSHMPFGIKVIDCKARDDFADKLTASVDYAEYLAVLDPKIKFSKESTVEEFFGQASIFSEKWIKKQQKEVSIDIKPLIESISSGREGDSTTIYMTVKAGSNENLNPELLLDALFKYDNLTVSKGDYRIIRLEIFDKSKKPFL